MIDQSKIEIEDFQGLYRWYDEDTVPVNHFKDCLNLEYFPKAFKSRSGLTLLHNTIGETIGLPRRIHRFEIPGEDDRLIVLDDIGGLYDSVIGFSSPILTIGSMTDFSMVSLFGRAYISPHDGLEGLQDTPLYVYDPSVSSVARLAAGDPPFDFELTVVSTIPSTPLTDVVAPVAPANGAMTLTTSPFIPIPPSTLKFTKVGGAVTLADFTVVGLDAAGEPQTELYSNIILSGGPLTYTTSEVWSEITSITVSGLVGAGGTWRVEITGKPGGKIERGYHIIAIAYETASGFITSPGPVAGDDTNYAVFLVTKAKRVLTVSGIPASPPAGTVKIHILASKAIVKNRYTGNPDEYELFFVPDTSGGIIDVGVTSTVINFFDADLVDSADFLKDNMSQIPAGVALLATSKGRLLIAGVNSTSVVGDNSEDDELANNTVIFGSVGGEPEAFSKTDGFVIIKPGGGGIRNLAEYRTLIYAYKDTRTFVTQDNGGLPVEWEIDSVDESIGAGAHSVALAMGSDSSSEDILVVGARAGIYPFNGSYAERPITWKIREIWDHVIKEDQFHRVEIVIDAINKFIYVAIPFDTDDYTGGFLLYGDYSDGMTWDTIKWCPWVFYRGLIDEEVPLNPTTIVATMVDSIPVLWIGSSDENIYQYQYRSAFTNDNGVRIISFYELNKSSFSENGGVSQITGIRQMITGGCTLHSSIIGPLDVTIETLPDEAIASNQTFNTLIKLNFVEDSHSYKALINGVNDQFQVTRIWLFGTEAWVERPQ